MQQSWAGCLMDRNVCIFPAPPPPRQHYFPFLRSCRSHRRLCVMRNFWFAFLKIDNWHSNICISMTMTNIKTFENCPLPEAWGGMAAPGKTITWKQELWAPPCGKGQCLLNHLLPSLIFHTKMKVIFSTGFSLQGVLQLQHKSKRKFPCLSRCLGLRNTCRLPQGLWLGGPGFSQKGSKISLKLLIRKGGGTYT